MPRGRLPKPDALKRAAGNPGKRKLAASTPSGVVTKVSSFTPPAWLSAPGSRIWKSLTPDLVRLNFLRATDVQAFGRYCDHMASWVKARKTVLKEGEYYDAVSTSGENLKRLHPATKAAELHEKHLVELEDRFGLSPLARQRILRDQAALPPGSLWGDRPPAEETKPVDPASPVLPEPPPAGSPIGLLARPIGRMQ